MEQKILETIVDYQSNVLHKLNKETYYFEWYYIYDDKDLPEYLTIPYQQINKKIKCKYKVENRIAFGIDITTGIEVGDCLWDVYQWKTVKDIDDININDDFNPDSLTGWVNKTNQYSTDNKYENWEDCIKEFLYKYYTFNSKDDFELVEYYWFEDKWNIGQQYDKETKLEYKKIHDEINKNRLKIKEPKKYLSRKNRNYLDQAWSAMVKVKDNNKCTKCNSKDNLEAHHIKSFHSFPEFRHDVNNGITLCGTCHRNHHKLNGYK